MSHISASLSIFVSEGVQPSGRGLSADDPANISTQTKRGSDPECGTSGFPAEIPARQEEDLNEG